MTRPKCFVLRMSAWGGFYTAVPYTPGCNGLPVREDRITDQDVELVAHQLVLWSHSVPGSRAGFERQARTLLSLVLGDSPEPTGMEHP